jgi:hypothetical protein
MSEPQPPNETDEEDTLTGMERGNVNKGERHKHWLTSGQKSMVKFTQVVVTYDPTDQPTQFPILVTEDGKRLPRDETGHVGTKAATISNRPNEK